METVVGYEYLRRTWAAGTFPVSRPAVLRPVTRLLSSAEVLAVPSSVAPLTEDPLAHVLFALKHEGTNLAILAEVLPHIPPGDLLVQIRRTPNGAYIRTVCYLWEHFAGRRLEDLPGIGGAATNIFDPRRYVTRPGLLDGRWRVRMNGLGSLRYCATVERTPEIECALKVDVLERANAFMATLPQGLLDQALAWAYLHETESSFAIEREAPSEDRARTFVAILRQAHERRPLSEPYLVALQNAMLTHPFDRAASFRTQQNWLRGPLRGAAGVSYVPPPPALLSELMAEWITWVNAAPQEIDPIVAASVASFGFVFLHPFMDGNGRLSRFLFHQVLCQSGRLDAGLILPVSIAMKKKRRITSPHCKPIPSLFGSGGRSAGLMAMIMTCSFRGLPLCIGIGMPPPASSLVTVWPNWHWIAKSGRKPCFSRATIAFFVPSTHILTFVEVLLRLWCCRALTKEESCRAIVASNSALRCRMDCSISSKSRRAMPPRRMLLTEMRASRSGSVRECESHSAPVNAPLD